MAERKQLTCNSFVFYGSFYEAISVLPLENQAHIYDAIFKFAFENTEVDLEGVELAVFLLIKPQLIANRARYENGCRGGRPRKDETETQPNEKQIESGSVDNKNQNKTKQKPKNNLIETKAKPNENDNENVNDYQVSKKENKENYKNNQACEGAHTRESYQDIMDNLMVEESVRPMLWSFIQHCQLNGHILTNRKLENILLQMDGESLSNKERINKLKDAINGGYYDIKREI